MPRIRVDSQFDASGGTNTRTNGVSRTLAGLVVAPVPNPLSAHEVSSAALDQE